MSKFFKTSLAFVGSILMVSTLYAQATIEEVIVTAQRTEQSLQDVPIAVSAFTDEMLSERQIEVASDIQLQVPGVAYSANTFGSGGFAIRGIANFATAASSDAGVEVHLNGLPLGATSTNEMGYMDMARIEVLRGPQGTLYGRNSTGGVVNLITARPDLDAFEGRAKIQYGKNNEKQLDLMLNVPISDELGLRVAYNNFEKEGVNKNLYSKLAGQPFDNRDSYMWRATLKWEAADDLTVTLLHSAFDEESSRTQQDGTWCQTGGNLVQGCVMGGDQVFNAIHPISNGSTVPGLLGQTLGFYVPSNLTNGTADEGRIYAPMNGNTPLLPQDTGTVPQDFFQSNVWAAPRHDVQESTSQFILDKDFDNGSLSYAYNDNQRQFYRDTTSLSSEGSGVRWSAGVKASALYAPSTDANGEGLPLGFSNSQIAPNCVVEEMKSGIFCPGGEGVRGNHILPVSGDAFHQRVNSKTHEIKYVSNLDGMFNFLVGAIDISNNTHSYYDVYASGITLNAYSLPGTIGSSTRSALRGALLCAATGSTTAPCSATAVATGNALLQADAIVGGAAALTAGIQGLGGAGTVTPFDLANDMVSRVDGLYTEHFHNLTDAYKLDSSAIFTEFYFDINERHRLTAGLRYNEDTKSVSVNATFYKVPVISNWNSGAAGAGGIGGDCGFDPSTGRAKSATYTAVPGTGGAFNSTSDNAACFNAGLDSSGARTIGQQIGMFPGGTVAQGTTNGSTPLGVLPANNADYTSFGIPTIKDFSETTGRLVWDFQINDDTLFYMSYAKGFKGGGFNPPFNAAQFPDTPFTFESTGVDSIEFGVKAAVPEVGLIANASVYYNDFKNFHIGVIRNETAINTGMPLENMGAELELYLTPPSVPGLSFNMMMSYATSEIGTFSMINPHDLGGHYRKQASTGNMDGYTDWHVSKNFTANSFLIAKEAMGTTYGRILDVQLAPVFAAMQVGGTVGDGGAGDAAAATANAGLAASNEIYRALHCTAGDGGTIAASSCGTKKALTANDVNLTMIPFESSAAAVGYGNLGQVCHNFASAGGVNSCLPAALGGTAAVAPTASLIYAGAEANATNTNSTTGMLLPSLVNRATGTDLQTGGVCGLFQAMVDHAGDVTRNNELSLATGEVCASTVVDGVTVKGKFLSSGLEQNLTGNEMPYPELTMSMGLAYTFQTNNLEVTPRLDYYYQSDAYSSVFNIEAQKIKAWDEINFSLMIVPTDADWNVRFWAQNLTDDRNVTGSGVGNSSVGHTTGVFVREGRSFGMSFGIGF
jgi:outer membrane receptor protein involved in Fe transport